MKVNVSHQENKMFAEDEYDDKVESTPWKNILQLFVNSYDKGRDSLHQQVANVFCYLFSHLEIRESKLTEQVSQHYCLHKLLKMQ